VTGSPDVSPLDGEGQNRHLTGQIGRRTADNSKEEITQPADREAGGEFVVRSLIAHVGELKSALNESVESRKVARIEHAKLTKLRDQLKSSVIDRKKERLSKESEAASVKAKLREAREAKSAERTIEIERLTNRVSDLESDIETFRETLRMHRRDRDRVFMNLQEAYSILQDLLTQNVLWKIVQMESETGTEVARQGLPGFTAELLGRLLVLEKEESQVSGMLDRLFGN